MIYLFLTNGILIVHLAFILFVVLGGLGVFYIRWMPWFHIPVVLWGALIEFSGWICPLTPLEKHFRGLAGQSGYDTGFVHHYLLKIIYPYGLTRTAQILLGLSVLIVNILVYAVYFKKNIVLKRKSQ